MGGGDAAVTLGSGKSRHTRDADVHNTWYCWNNFGSVCGVGRSMDTKARVDHVMLHRSIWLAAAIKAAEAGATAVMKHYGLQTLHQIKSDGTPVTIADTDSHDIICEQLHSTGIDILSEEGDNRTASGEHVWVVDPLDGTSDFIDQTGEFTVMVSLVYRGRPIVGAISHPTVNTIYAAEAGSGAWMRTDRWRRIRVRLASQIKGCTVVCSRHHLTAMERRFVNSLEASRIVTVGSSLKCARIASGVADLYVTFTDRMRVWDTAASHCILHEAGGRMTDTQGGELQYGTAETRHRAGILATGGAIHHTALNMLASLKQTSSLQE